ncbi:MAG: MBL fold metallo-hydrolase [Candidatus Tectomicrobia bacterium]|uniref:MBL fold metallo-hydrolase n=1 Tax=Tectimicrobiota bacterium TaxID=2528274 RepID=A0A932HYG8_UNCTE|nr:MBL fold metallo-hydrolase [Candidatus Tectomicrobia bacterium]
MRQLSKHVYAETGYDWANVGAVVTDEGLVLIDCPVRPSNSQHWQNEIRPLSAKGIKYIIGTDYHGDHTTGSAFVEGPTFIAPQRVFDEISRTAGKHPFAKALFVNTLRDQGHTREADEIEAAVVPAPQICFEESMILHLPPLTFEIRRLGGHSPACSVVYVPEEGVLFSSDVAMDSPTPGMRDANVKQWIAALDWIEKLNPGRIVPGHGEIGGLEIVRKLRSYLQELSGVMEKVVRAGRSMEEAVRDPSFDRFFWADASKGAFWAQERRETFQKGLETVYKEARAALAV